jgi:hypothetical protein
MHYKIEILHRGAVKRSLVCEESLIHIELEELGEFIVPAYDEEDLEEFSEVFNKYQSYTTAIYDKQVIIYPDHGPWLCKVSKGKFLINPMVASGGLACASAVDGGVLIQDPNNSEYHLRIVRA